MDYQIAHAIEGRIRVRIPQLASDPEYAGKLQSLIEARQSITSVRINPLAQSIVITYKAKAIPLELMQVQIQQAIEQLSPPPAPPPAPAPPSAPVATQTESMALEDDPWEDRAIAPLAQPSPQINQETANPLPELAIQAEATAPSEPAASVAALEGNLGEAVDGMLLDEGIADRKIDAIELEAQERLNVESLHLEAVAHNGNQKNAIDLAADQGRDRSAGTIAESQIAESQIAESQIAESQIAEPQIDRPAKAAKTSNRSRVNATQSRHTNRKASKRR